VTRYKLRKTNGAPAKPVRVLDPNAYPVTPFQLSVLGRLAEKRFPLMAHHNWAVFAEQAHEQIHMEATMRKKLMMLIAAAAFLVIGSSAFEAKATMSVGTESLSAHAKSYSPVERASCNGKGLFCQSGSTLQCKPLCVCVPCSTPAPVRVKRHKKTG
jgi:hypothetical protein